MQLLERDGELATLLEVSAECLDGKGHVVTVSGPVASGKTELLCAFAERVTNAGAQFVGAAAAYTERALPLGVVGQVFYGAQLPDQQRERVMRLLRDGMVGSSSVTQSLPLHTLDELCTELLEMARRQPLVIGVDDLHHADPHSVQCLSHLIPRSRSAPIMLVLAESTRRASAPALDPELLAQPHCRRIHLRPLSRTGVHTLVRRRFGTGATDQFAAAAHTLSGGNPLLVGALIEDTQTDSADSPRLVARKAFSQAFLRCLYRCDSTAIAVARWLAVLGESATTHRIAQLSALRPDSVDQAIRALNAGGLLAHGRYADAAARAAVLDGLEAEARTAMHAEAAAVLHHDRAPARVVAGHLLAADDATPDWAMSVLRAAAELALAAGDVDLAMNCLRLALRAEATAPERAATLVLLVSAHWRVNPSVAVRHLDELTAMARAGHITGPRALDLVGWLSWFGRADEAVELIAGLRESAAPEDESFRASLCGTRLNLAHLYPRTAPLCRPVQLADASSAVKPEIWAAEALTGALSGRADGALRAAGQTLLDYRLDERTWPVIHAMITALVYGDELAAATRCCESFLDQADAQHARVWKATLTCLRAEIALRQGDLPGTEGYARTALSLLSLRNWGVSLGHPVALLVRACTAMDRHEDALGYLRLPVPDAMFGSAVGLLYLRARGAYHHATGRHAAALSDFETCGELMRRWGIDLPLLLPWRTEAARTLLHIGRLDRAHELAAEQLRLLPARPSRTRGANLRILAATREPKQRVALLSQAVDILNACGDRVELVRTLTDLSQEYRALGQNTAARMHAHHARTIASRWGLSLAGHPPLRPVRAREADRLAELSEAERRVVLLATQGLTNRQVAARLHVTVSTVEQHLTKVYRKLRVTRRADLPIALHAADDTSDLVKLG